MLWDVMAPVYFMAVCSLMHLHCWKIVSPVWHSVMQDPVLVGHTLCKPLYGGVSRSPVNSCVMANWSHWILSTVEGRGSNLSWLESTYVLGMGLPFPSSGLTEAHPLWGMVPHWMLSLGIFCWKVRHSAGAVASSVLESFNVGSKQHSSLVSWCYMDRSPWMAHDSVQSELLCLSF